MKDSFIVFVITLVIILSVHHHHCACLGEDVSTRDVQIQVFVADLCGHCRAIKGEIRKLEAEAEGYPHIFVSVYTMEQDGERMKREGVSMFPTIRIAGKAYEGERTAQAILSAGIEASR